MLTSPSARAVERDNRPSYRPFSASVARVTELSSHFVRVTFTDPGLATFGVDGLDQRVKIFFPLADGSLSDIGERDPETLRTGDWYTRWRALPADRQSPFRTYTVRAIRPDECEVDVDFVRHPAPESGTATAPATPTAPDAPAAGPAARWLATVAPGDRVTIAGPDALSIHSHIGIDWKPGTARQLLLAGDETAAPAILSILESLPAGREAHAIIEVPDSSDAAALAAEYGPAITVTWLGRGGHAHGELLHRAVSTWLDEHPALVADAASPRPQRLDDINVDTDTLWDSPDPEVNTAEPGDFYAWIAGESSVIKTLRRHLVSERGVDRKRVAFMGYWRQGQSEKQG